ncbi:MULTISPECIES: DUF3152 domain-containing protein [unclassified Streptomyces]|uniref:DUF3152 domain-containing protein n=1 Tax=unclassified Streptomyces TaxID=2593676 RepID=UPI0003664DE1|nr:MULTISPECIES: DUF3152 domain-containing protein [unclassified Streptomyces]MYX33780.1 DUF3152 domain-containing protein [Streptomyces sp. SID8377]
MTRSRTNRPAATGPRRRAAVSRLAVLLVLAVCAVGLYAVTAGRNAGERTAPAAAQHGPAASAVPSPAPTRTAKPKPARSQVPEHGDGRFTSAPGTSRTLGHGTPLRYGVEVEDGTGFSAASVAAEVDRILADKRGWTTAGAAFRRVDSPPYDFLVRLATPDTTDALCAEYGLDTGGEVNCSGGKDVVVNLKRWVLLSPYYKGRPAEYRALIINHEVGHRLGRGHRGCPGHGRLAPAMMQQIKGLHGCTANAWPYDRHGHAITGPAVP